jgi:hypothetical protein
MSSGNNTGPLIASVGGESILTYRTGVPAQPQVPLALPGHVAQPRQMADRRILLLDGDLERRNSRMKALTDRGAQVDGVGTGADARSLWNPGSHELVMIELRNAGADVEEFYAYAHAVFRKQRFGFYLTAQPYVTHSYVEYEATRESEAAPPPSKARAFAGDAGPRLYQVGLPEAARRIAAIRRLVSPRPAGSDPGVRAVPVSDAMKIAQRVLTGSANTE